jgi:hypothetical protein
MFVLIVSQAELNQYGVGERNVDTHGGGDGDFARLGRYELLFPGVRSTAIGKHVQQGGIIMA